MPAFSILSPLTTKEMFDLHAALVKCGFKIDDDIGKHVFERFGELLSMLNAQERELILTLLSDFLHCGWFEYFPLLKKAFESIPSAVVGSASTVILLPLAETRPNGKPKSSSALMYPAENHILPYLPAFAAKAITVYEKMQLLQKDKETRDKALIILLDDFIGSGSSALTALEKLQPLRNTTDTVVIASIVAQKQGIEAIAAKGVDTYAAIVRTKGISESTLILDRERALLLMDSLEVRLGVKQKYMRGHGKCEALVAMMRTPNSTFPVFWHPTTSSGEKWPAPFRRFG